MLENPSHQRLSHSIECLRFPLILLIICLHCYTSTSVVTRGHEAYFRLIYPISLWMGETGVPTFFFISGFLLFYSKKNYAKKVKSRIKTLLIPYLFFNGLILCTYLSSMLLGNTVIIAGKNLADYSLIDYLRAFWDRGAWSHGNGAPVLCPFWYIRNLMILVILSPIVYYLIKYTKLFFPLIFGTLWINEHNSAYAFQSLTMFFLGAYFPICNKNPLEIYEKYKQLVICTFLLLATLDILHLFVTIPNALMFHRLSLIANTFLLISFLGDYLHRHHIYSSFLSKSAFFIFCIHYPMTTYLRTIFSKLDGFPDYILFAIFLVSIICILFLCVIAYKLLISIMPKFVNFITGNRGAT